VGQGLVGLPAALAVMLGADVGTSVMAVVFSLDLSWLSPLFIFVGVVLFISRKDTAVGRVGRVLIGLGLMLLALRLITESTTVLTQSPTVRTLLVDEVDEFANNLSGGDDPLEMLNGRTSAFPATYKRLYISTPQIKGLSRIEQLWAKSDQRRYHVPCPHCGHMQHLQWSGLHWTPDASTCWYVC